MKIVLLTPGTGSYHCGVCIRDNALAKELHRQGHDAVILPMYLPLTLDDAFASRSAPIFFGGINVYLQQKFALFRRTPRWLDNLFNHHGLLRRVAGSSASQTGGATVGALTHSMLMGDEGKQAKELEHLIEWLTTHDRPDAVWFSTALLIGLARRIKQTLGVPVVASLQGEDSFLDGLSEPWRGRCWSAMVERSKDVDVFVAPSRYYAEFMGRRMRLNSTQLQVVANGIDPSEYHRCKRLTGGPVIGYLARLIEGKGLSLVVDAFIRLKQKGNIPNAKLRCAGAMTKEDQPYVNKLRQKLLQAGLLNEAEFFPNITREEKIDFLGGLTLLSVPATYGEAFGLYLLEAWAAGVPVVQPNTAAYPELIEEVNGGLLFEVNQIEDLVEKWEHLLLDSELANRLGQNGREAVAGRFSISAMANAFVDLTREKIDARLGAH